MKLRVAHSIVSIVAIVLLGAARANAADYWVKNGGSNAASGLSVAVAWATLDHAADQVGPGDTVHVLDGSYTGFYLERSGTSGNPITFRAEGSSVQIVADNGTTPDGINLEGASHVVIDGFIVNDRTRAGIRAVLGEFVTVRNCKMGSNGRWGVLSGFVDDLLIENNEAHHSEIEHGIYVSNSGDRPVIRDNLVHDNFANGIHMNGDLSEGGDGVITGAVVERNVIYGNGANGGSGINMDGVTNSVVRNNLLYDNHASGVSLYRIDGGAPSTGNLVVNNTIVNAANARWCVNIRNGSSGNTIVNNILYNQHEWRGVISIDAASLSGTVSDYNTVMSRFSTNGGGSAISLSAWQALGFDTHSILATPAALFVVPGNDFHPRSDAPAVDAGRTAGAPPEDIEGGARPVGGGFDIGAYELQLDECGDGGVDMGEQCGEPGLGCASTCQSCVSCVCVLDEPLCGDDEVCGSEQCEDDGDCSGGRVCSGCACVNPPVCTSGISLAKPRLRARANPFSLSLTAEAVIPKPWTGVDPPANGVRFVVDGASGAGGFDVTIPGGAGWVTNPAGTRWTWSGNQGGIKRVIVRDALRVQDGRLRVVVRGAGGSVPLPAADDLRGAVVLGAALECAQIAFGGPGDPRPRCSGDAERLSCR